MRMAKVVVINHVTLDGVMQGPGRPDEDRRGGFEQGGWSPPYGDEIMGAALGERMAQSSGLLFGRRTYEDLLSYWNTQDSPFKDALNNAPKYVASNTLSEPAPWPNTTLLRGDAAPAVAELKEKEDGELQVMGSGVLIQALMQRNLIDEYMLLVNPIVLGSGRCLFAEGSPPASLRLVGDVTTTRTGVVIATYQPAPEASAAGSTIPVTASTAS
jgi:dihydrofolate reductase